MKPKLLGLVLSMYAAAGMWAVAAYGQEQIGFYRIVSSEPTKFTKISLDGTAAWTGSILGSTGIIQKTTSLQAGWQNWTNTYQFTTTDAVMTAQLFIRQQPGSAVIRLEGGMAFGNLTVGQSETRALAIHNDGNSPLTISSIDYPLGFSGAWSGVIESLSSQTVTVTFIPQAAQEYIGTIMVNSDAISGTSSLSVSGTGIVLAAPSDMVLIPDGIMNVTDPDFGAYRLVVSSFYIDKYEVTKAKWDEVKNWSDGYGYSYEHAGSGKAANHPVQWVSWYDVVKWCNARSQKEGRTPAYYIDAGLTQIYKTGYGPYNNSMPVYVKSSANGYRLPMTEEWEYAARGGEGNRRFPWSNTDWIYHTRANYWSTNSFFYDQSATRGYHPTFHTSPSPYTAPVGSFAANRYGLYDMAGNVWEWCFDRSAGYVQGWDYGVFRGGAFGTKADECRIAFRRLAYPDTAIDNIGFRTVLLQPRNAVIRLIGSLAFGNITVWQSATSTLTIYNDGNSPMKISSIDYPSGYSGEWSGVIAGLSNQTVTVTFSPQVAKEYIGTVTVNSDATSGANTKSVSGTGTAAVMPQGGDPTAVSWTEVNARWVKNFYENGAITMNDRDTGLMWAYNASVNGTATWGGSISYCDNLSYAGYSDWFLPSSSQLIVIYYEKAFFANVQATWYWSSTRQWVTPYAVSMIDRQVGGLNESSVNWIWPCRSR